MGFNFPTRTRAFLLWSTCWWFEKSRTDSQLFQSFADFYIFLTLKKLFKDHKPALFFPLWTGKEKTVIQLVDRWWAVCLPIPYLLLYEWVRGDKRTPRKTGSSLWFSCCLPGVVACFFTANYSCSITLVTKLQPEHYTVSTLNKSQRLGFYFYRLH